MRSPGIALPLVILVTACGGATPKIANERASHEARTSSGGPTIAVTGCVEPSDTPGQYVLRNVRFPPPPQQPSDTLGNQPITITEGSWVRLRVHDDGLLKDRLGKVVTVAGTLVDDGRNTIGTSGGTTAPEQPEARQDKSRAATSEHPSAKVSAEAGPIDQRMMNNGSVPEIAVEHVSETGQSCPKKVEGPTHRK